MPKRVSREPRLVLQRSNAEIRASAGRIVDILQQLVIARPEMIVPLEEIVRGILANLRVHVETQLWRNGDEPRASDQQPLPPVPLSELPALLALLEPPATRRATGKRAAKAGRKKRQ